MFTTSPSSPKLLMSFSPVLGGFWHDVWPCSLLFLLNICLSVGKVSYICYHSCFSDPFDVLPVFWPTVSTTAAACVSAWSPQTRMLACAFLIAENILLVLKAQKETIIAGCGGFSIENMCVWLGTLFHQLYSSDFYGSDIFLQWLLNLNFNFVWTRTQHLRIRSRLWFACCLPIAVFIDVMNIFIFG